VLKETLLLVDGNSEAYRAFYSGAGREGSDLESMSGEPTGMIYKFLRSLASHIYDFRPSHALVVFDGPRSELLRRKKYPAYKAQRDNHETPDSFISQIGWVKKLMKLSNAPTFLARGYEADDVIATAARLWRAWRRPGNVIVITRDKDLERLARGNVTIYDAFKAEMKTRADIEMARGLDLNQLCSYWSMVGDHSDNVPGVPGIGPKRALALLKEFYDWNGILDNLDKINPKIAQEFLTTEARLSHELIQLDSHVPGLPSFKGLSLPGGRLNLRRAESLLLDDLSFDRATVDSGFLS
jgi:5'-3' exonuclease